MQKLRKSLSALLAVVMLISVFSFAASAGVDPIDSAAPQNIAMKLEVEHADGTAATTVEPGETVTVNVYVTAKDAGARIYSGAIQFFWDSNVYTYVEGSRTWGLSSIDAASMYAVNNTQAQYTNTVANMTPEEKAYGWNICGNFQVSNDAAAPEDSLIQAGSATPFISIKLKVSETVADGTPASIGIPVTSIAPKNTTRMNYTYISTKTDGSTKITQNKSKNLYIMDTIAALTVATPAAGPAVAKSKAEVKMTPNSATTVKDAFSFRVTSKITDADWDAYFANSADSAATKNAIKSVGFVAYKGTTGFNLDTAKAVAQGTTSAAGYDVATTDYIQKVNDTSDAYFGCRLEITSAATRSDVTYVAFVQYRDASGNIAYAFYDAEQQALLNTNYNTIVSTYLAAHPYAG